MKTTVLALVLSILFTNTTTAQDSSKTTVKPILPEYLPSKGDLGLTLNISQIFSDFKVSGPSDGVYEHLFLRKYTKDQTALRFGFGLNTQSTSFTRLDSLNGTQNTQDSSFSQSTFYLSFGVEKHLFTNSRLDPYFAPTISYGRIGTASSKNTLASKDTIGTATSTITTEIPGGSNFRIGIAVGFNYFFAKKIALGAEYSLGYNYQTTGGDYSIVRIDKSVSGTETITRTAGTNYRSKGGLSMIGSGRLSLSYFF